MKFSKAHWLLTQTKILKYSLL